MSLIIEHLIIHSLRHDDSGVLTADTRAQELAASDEVQAWVEQLHKTYQQKGSKSYAFFADDKESQPEFPQLFTSYLTTKSLDFVTFSHQATQLLLQKLNQYESQDQGVLVFCTYQYLATNYVLLGLLDCETSVTLTDTLELSEIKYIDLAKMQLVARIDVTEMQTQPESRRYISFIKGRMGRKVSDFFMEFLGAEEGIDAALQNKLLVRAVNEYCEQLPVDSSERADSKKRVTEYCKEQSSEGDDIVIKSVAEYLPKQGDGSDFYSFISDTYDLEDEFPAAAKDLRKLTKLVGSGGGLNISFDERLMDERIRYDADTDTLTIHGTPPNLKDQLLRRLNKNG